ncbi:unnamed protein product [Pedinophyceae sp. YPF-701]|nr:unnamed protein product [Pedinophyceae sp. YPF-701]
MGQAAASRPGMLRQLAGWVARAIQAIIFWLESLIELLGQEPEARISTTQLLDGIGVRFFDPAQVCSRAEDMVNRGDLDRALQLYIRVIEHHPEHTAAMDAAAEILAEMGDGEGAKELVLRSIELRPDLGHQKYVLLGHLEYGNRALDAFSKGLELLNEQMGMMEAAAQEGGAEAAEAARRLRDMKKAASAVLAAQAKVWLTDCFEEPGAMRCCEDVLDKALRLDSGNPEACQALADVRLSQGREGEALLLARRAVEIIRGLPEGLAPTYDFRMVTARLLVELSEYKDALELLVELTAEDDRDTEAWYLQGLCYMMSGDGKRAREALIRAKTLIEEVPTSDTALLGQISTLLTRRIVTEEEKAKLWNPRGWLQRFGSMEQQAVDGSVEGGKREEAAVGAVSVSPELMLDVEGTKGRDIDGARLEAARRPESRPPV